MKKLEVIKQLFSWVQIVKTGEEVFYGIGKTQDNQPTRWFLYFPVFITPWKKPHHVEYSFHRFYGRTTWALRIVLQRKHQNMLYLTVEWFDRSFGKQKEIMPVR